MSELPPVSETSSAAEGRRSSGSLRKFLSAWLDDPRGIGAVAPSSRKLGRTMASFVDRDRLVVEVGAGTGPVTEALLESGVPAERLVAVEQSGRLAEHLTRRFPAICVVEGDAAEIGKYIGDEQVGKVGAVVSSLPLRSLPKGVCTAIVAEMHRILAPDGLVIQFTYDPRQGDFYRDGFERVDHRWVLGNLPPARVDVFEKDAGRKMEAQST